MFIQRCHGITSYHRVSSKHPVLQNFYSKFVYCILVTLRQHSHICVVPYSWRWGFSRIFPTVVPKRFPVYFFCQLHTSLILHKNTISRKWMSNRFLWCVEHNVKNVWVHNEIHWSFLRNLEFTDFHVWKSLCTTTIIPSFVLILTTDLIKDIVYEVYQSHLNIPCCFFRHYID